MNTAGREDVGWVGERVLITGSTGFIGQRLVRRLVEAGACVYAGVAPGEEPERTSRLPEQAQRLTFDLREAGAVRDAVTEAMPQVVFHLAAVGVTQPDVAPDVALAVNVGGTLHLLEALSPPDPRRICARKQVKVYTRKWAKAREFTREKGESAKVRTRKWAKARERWEADEHSPRGQTLGRGDVQDESTRGGESAKWDVRRIVLVGTSHEYGAREAVEGLDPFSVYAASKVAAWAFGRMYWRVYGLPVVIVRPFQVYGPGQPDRALIPAAVHAALAGEDFPMTPGEQERDFIYVDDVVDGLQAIAKAPGIEGQSLDLGTGQAHAVRQVVGRIWEMLGARGRILPGALPYRLGEVMHLVADADRTARLTGWRAKIGLEEGLRRVIEAAVNTGAFYDRF